MKRICERLVTLNSVYKSQNSVRKKKNVLECIFRTPFKRSFANFFAHQTTQYQSQHSSSSSCAMLKSIISHFVQSSIPLIKSAAVLFMYLCHLASPVGYFCVHHFLHLMSFLMTIRFSTFSFLVALPKNIYKHVIKNMTKWKYPQKTWPKTWWSHPIYTRYMMKSGKHTSNLFSTVAHMKKEEEK